MRTELDSGKDKQLRLPYSKMSLGIEYKGVTIEDDGHWYWCVSPIEDENDRIHLFCSRWECGGGLEYWRTQCEIAHFVSDFPEGPFEFQEIILDNSMLPEPEWQASPHNPHIAFIDGMYVLTYIVQDKRKDGGYGTSIGQMTAKSPDGPWEFVNDSGIVLRPSEDINHWTYNGKPAYLYGCTRASVNGTGKSENYVFKINEF